jgi:diguanylate cyclase (GGDEF)-like protein
VLARYGGDEFALLLPDCSAESALVVVDRLRTAMPSGQTCSAGLTCWDGVISAEELVGRADAALLEAKRAGRDQVVK